MKKKELVQALAKMSEVGTKGIKAEYEKAHRVTMQVEDDRVLFGTSNGLLDAKWEVTVHTDTNLKCDEKGQATVDVVVAKRIADAIGGKKTDNLIEVFVNESDASPSLHMKDVESKAKKTANMVTIPEHQSMSIPKPRNGFRYEFKSEEFISAVGTVSKYVARTNYMPRYLMMCLHFLKDQTRFVCGDGSFFGILSFKLETENVDIKDDDGQKFIMPCDQAQIVANLCRQAQELEIIYKDNMTCYIKPLHGDDSAMTLLMKGIPNDTYISYDKHAFNFDGAQIVVDMDKAELLEGMNLIGAVKDKEKLEKEGFHYCDFIISGGNRAEFVVKDARFQADYDMTVTAYGDVGFESCYAHDYLTFLAEASEKPFIRFYGNDPASTAIAEPVDPNDNQKDDKGIPSDAETNPRLSFFFASATDDEDDDE